MSTSPPVRPSMGFIQRSIVYPSSMFDVVIEMLGYMKRHGYGEYVREELVDEVIKRVQWAKSAGKDLVAFLVFWWLYATWNDYVEMTHDVERAANPLSSSAQELANVKLFAFNRIQAFRSTPYLPCNVNALVESMRRAFLLGAHLRFPAVLQSQPLDPTRVDKEERATPVMLLHSQADQEFCTRMKRTIAEYVRSIDWQGVEQCKQSNNSDGRSLAIQVSAFDYSNAESIV